jgi:hypothetical protein
VTRIYLDLEARKIKTMFCGPVGGAAIMLDPFDQVTTGLHVGEGLETCMTAREWDMRPVWALGSDNGVAQFPVLAGVECLTMLAENGCAANACAVEACGVRWHDAGREVRVDRAVFGKDLNDALRHEA